MTPKYIRDIHAYLETIPYGDVWVKVTRVNRKTVNVGTRGKETLRYQDTPSALADVNNILQGLVEQKYSGKAHVECEYKDGEIKIVAIHDEKETKY